MKRLLVLVTAILLASAAAPAQAERWSTSDPAGDHVAAGGQDFGGRGDVLGLRVDHAPRRVFVDTRFRTGPYDELMVFWNTRARRRGPELVLYRTHQGVTLWRTGPGHRLRRRVPCADLGVRRAGRTWRARVSRSCLAGTGRAPRRVKVKVLSADETYGWTLDWAPGERRASPWVRVGQRR